MAKKTVKELEQRLWKMQREAGVLGLRLEIVETKIRLTAAKIFKATTGHELGGYFEYKGQNYRIDGVSRVAKLEHGEKWHCRARVAAYLEEYLTGQSRSPFKFIDSAKRVK